MDILKGRYWDEGITLVESCTPCSPGCEHCWALAMERRFKPEFKNQITIHPERLKRFNTRKPKVFSIWNDLFHEAVSFDFILATLIHAVGRTDNKYLILSKRPQQMVRFFQWMEKEAMLTVEIRDCFYFGLTVCNQQEAFEKLSDFKKVPGKKFLSLEPLLSDIPFLMLSEIDCVICGGETGPGARPMHPDWVRSVRDQCAAVGVNFFFKSWGKHMPAYSNCYGKKEVKPIDVLSHDPMRLLDGRTHDELPWVKGVVE
jgi:protein gp37